MTKAPQPARLIVGVVDLGWDGDHLTQSLDHEALFGVDDELAPGLELSLVGCVGLLGRVRLQENGELGWQFEFTARGTTWSPTRTCKTGEVLHVFAVSPAERVHDGGRGEVDVDGVYATLPKKQRAWHEQQRSPVPLALWADLDDDGETDLVAVDGPCEDPSATCRTVLAREAGKWKLVGQLGPV